MHKEQRGEEKPLLRRLDQKLNLMTQAFSKEEVIHHLSENEKSAVYTLIQILKVSAVWMWLASSCVSFFIATLFNPDSSLMEWSLSHKSWVVATASLLLGVPSYFIFFLTFQLDPIARKLNQQRNFKFFSPVQVWLICSAFFFLFILSLATLTSAFYA